MQVWLPAANAPAYDTELYCFYFLHVFSYWRSLYVLCTCHVLIWLALVTVFRCPHYISQSQLLINCWHNLALLYLANDLHWTDESEALQQLRSGARQRLIVPRTRLRTIGDRAFGVAASCVWNSLPPVVTTASSLPSFKRQLKTFLFWNTFP